MVVTEFELGLLDWLHPLDIINSLIGKLSEETKESRSILFLDEVLVRNVHTKSDLSQIDYRDNVDVLIAVNPQGVDFKQRFMIIPPKNKHTYKTVLTEQ